jgi:hypothetical protein
MYCPKCRTEYRPGFTRCSDCLVNLVHELPAEELEEEKNAPLWLDVESLSELWRGEDTVLHDRLVGELKHAGIPYETQPTREAAGCGIDPVARGVEPRFGFIVRIQPKDNAAAVQILYKLMEEENVDLSIPVDRSTAYRMVQDKTMAAGLTATEAEEDEAQEMKCVWEGNDAAKRDFVRASLREHGVASDPRFQGENYRILVGDALQAKAVATIREIVEGKSPTYELPDPKSRAETSFTKYQLFFSSLATGLVVPVVLLYLVQSIADDHFAAQLLAILVTCVALGAVWTAYQALRYETRPGIYLLMAILPFSFVWYYFGRYKPRAQS